MADKKLGPNLVVYDPTADEADEQKLDHEQVYYDDTGLVSHRSTKSGRHIYIYDGPRVARRPIQIEWQEAYLHLIALAFNGLFESDEKQIQHELWDWFGKRGTRPSDRTLSNAAKAIKAEIDRVKKAGE